MHLNAIFKGLTAKSVFSDSDPPSVCTSMLGSPLHSSHDSVRCGVHIEVSVSQFFSLSPSLPCCSFSTAFFSVRSVPLFVSFCVGANGWVALLWQVWGRYSMLGLAVKTESARHTPGTNLYLAMQLLNKFCEK